MKLNDALENHYVNSSTASQNVRTLAIAAVALVWIFKTEAAQNQLELPAKLIVASFFIIAALACDFLQYLWGSFIWWQVHRQRELEFEGDREREFEISVWVNRPSYFFFWSKMLAVVVGYTFILWFLAFQIKSPW